MLTQMVVLRLIRSAEADSVVVKVLRTFLCSSRDDVHLTGKKFKIMYGLVPLSTLLAVVGEVGTLKFLSH